MLNHSTSQEELSLLIELDEAELEDSVLPLVLEVLTGELLLELVLDKLLVELDVESSDDQVL